MQARSLLPSWSQVVRSGRQQGISKSSSLFNESQVSQAQGLDSTGIALMVLL
jgi:hypothetical protein